MNLGNGTSYCTGPSPPIHYYMGLSATEINNESGPKTNK